MNIQPKLTGDLNQRFVVRKRVGDFDWVSVGWAHTLREAEAIERHFRTDWDALEMCIVDREARKATCHGTP